MLCPVCNGEMWDMSKSKFPKKHGSPDFKCKDKECKFQLNRKTGEYEPGEYTTAVWIQRKPQVPEIDLNANSARNKPISKPPVKPITPNNDNISTNRDEMMAKSYAKDVLVAMIAKGLITQDFTTCCIMVSSGAKLILGSQKNDEVPEEPIENPFDKEIPF